MTFRLSPFVPLNDYDEFFDRGVEKYEKGDLRRAIADYKQAIVLNPNDALAYMNRGVAYTELKESQKAIADLQKAANLYQQQ